jgi:hypothetical protein
MWITADPTLALTYPREFFKGIIEIVAIRAADLLRATARAATLRAHFSRDAYSVGSNEG